MKSLHAEFEIIEDWYTFNVSIVECYIPPLLSKERDLTIKRGDSRVRINTGELSDPVTCGGFHYSVYLNNSQEFYELFLTVDDLRADL